MQEIEAAPSTSRPAGPGGDPARGRFPEFQAPHLAPGQPCPPRLTTGWHTSVSAGKSLLVSVKEAVRLFAQTASLAPRGWPTWKRGAEKV